MARNQFLTTVALVMFSFASFASNTLYAQFDLSWHTVDGGGGHSVGGSFEIEGTIGQPDAGFMSGGSFELYGGFWTTALVLGDANGDGVLNNLDIASFVLALINPVAYQAMFPDVDPEVVLDMNQDGTFNNLDIAGFVAALIGGGTT